MRTVLSAVALLLAGACTAPRTPSAAQPQPAATVAADGTRVYEVREVDAEPRPRNVHALRRELERSYPAELRDAAISGRVDVRFRLDREGVPRDIRVTRSTDRRFDQPTVESVGSCALPRRCWTAARWRCGSTFPSSGRWAADGHRTSLRVVHPPPPVPPISPCR